MTTSTDIISSPDPEQTERSDSPESSSSAENSPKVYPKAAVGFDAADQKLRIITSENIADATEKGAEVDVDGRMLTILEFCDSIESARASCEEHLNGLNGMGLSSVKFEHEEDGETAQETSTSGLGEREDGVDMAEFEEDTLDNDVTANAIGDLDASAAFGGVAFSVVADLQQQIEEMKNTMRDAVAITMNDLQFDVDRLHQKQDNLVQLFQRLLGTGKDGRVIQPFNDKYPSKPFDGAHVTSRPSGKRPEDIINTHFYALEKMWSTRQAENEKFVRDEILSNPLLMGNRAKPKAAPTTSTTTTTTAAAAVPTVTSAKRPTAVAENGEQEYTFGTNGTQGKRIVNGIVKSVDTLAYPFMSQEEEEECLDAAAGQAPIYAQLLAKILFADTIMLYFKDQDTAKRNWLHDAVDYRFPTLDKPTHVSKWKNCSFFINKNMREAVIASGSSMPRAPCGPRGPIGPKDKFKSDSRGEDGSINDEEEEEVVTRTPKVKQVARVNRESSLEGIDWDYLESDYEKECYEECRGDQYKYAELMALRLFSTTLSIKFKEQDQVRKDWLRACVEARFPIEDRERNDQRWKICGQTCNRNRTKVVGADGREERYPYFDQAIEEECFRLCDGQVPIYAELMNAKLFPDTQHMFFKDQDLGKRNWLHTILDKRFPSVDKVTQTSKWKACTNAINKKLFDGTVTPITKEALIQSNLKEELDNSKMSVVVETPEETPRASVLRFERRRQTSEAPSPAVTPNLKRKAPEEVETPSAPAAKRESARNRQKKEKEQYSAYPYVPEDEEMAIFEASNGNPQVYGRELGRILFADTIKNYFKDQDPEKRQWIHEILDFRFPSKNQLESKQKWKNVTAAINRNMTTAVVSRRSLPR